MSVEGVDAANNRVGNVAPRVTEGDIAANIVGEYYFTAQDGVAGVQAIAKAAKLAIGLSEAEAGQLVAPILVKAHPCLRLLTLCVLITRSGFMVCGTSAPASPENFNAELGKKFARENAVKQLWPLMGYALRERLHAITPRVDIWPEAAVPVVLDNGAAVVKFELGEGVALGFCGFLTAELPELHGTHPQKLADSWKRYKSRVASGEWGTPEADREALARGGIVDGGPTTDAVHHPNEPQDPPNPVPDPPGGGAGG